MELYRGHHGRTPSQWLIKTFNEANGTTLNRDVLLTAAKRPAKTHFRSLHVHPLACTTTSWMVGHRTLPLRYEIARSTRTRFKSWNSSGVQLRWFHQPRTGRTFPAHAFTILTTKANIVSVLRSPHRQATRRIYIAEARGRTVPSRCYLRTKIGIIKTVLSISCAC